MHLLLRMPGISECAGILDRQSPFITAPLWLGRMAASRYLAAEKELFRVRGEILFGGS